MVSEVEPPFAVSRAGVRFFRALPRDELSPHGCAHDIPRLKPQAVIDAIDEVVRAARGTGR